MAHASNVENELHTSGTLDLVSNDSFEERPLPLAYSGTANREVAHLGLSTNRIARYPHMALNHHHKLCSPDDYVISCLLPATPSILL
ncbi:hypothetical protein TNIN_422951 [Trichonephila inaurata madagascariensis]|uniref:Uncharacterized protein n=1 Tax=Trichonephila inaurata madagascariensis TaxID=2747483 RepID=A0A8X6WZE8_9ARAC|nr:hypothetical protein TNIN_422951 [Trichonephila inaurata madagascariensis]